MTQSKRISYFIMAALLVLIGWFHLGTLVLTTFFGYFALQQFSFNRKQKTLGVAIYLVVVTGIFVGLFLFSREAYKQLPEIADKTIPAVVNFAEKQGIELPFTNYAELREVAVKKVQQGFAQLGEYAYAAVFQLVLLIIGLVVALSLFLNRRWGADEELTEPRNTLYSTVVRELVVRFQTFYKSFSRVIGAQIIISAVNTVLTGIFLIWNGFPYAMVLIVLTFLCGLLPIIGNIISNTLIVGVAFTIPETGPRMALFALIFLVVIHKLEYFLNSKIIGDRIKNPMWLTLIGIVLGEKLMGIPGMILAPVVLHYIKVEASRNKITETVPEVVKQAPPGK